MTTRRTITILASIAALLLAPGWAWAQGEDAAASTSARAASAQPGPLKIERIRPAFVVTPDVKVTRVDDVARTLAGAYGGWLLEDTLLIGGGGYWMTDHSSDHKLAYGGFVTQWTLPLGSRVRVGARGLLGGGRATISRQVTTRLPGGLDFDRDMGHWRNFDQAFDAWLRMGPRELMNPLPTVGVTRRVRRDTGFLVAEPQADVLLRLNSWIAINAGVGYRFVGSANGLDRYLRGAAGSFGVRIGRTS